MARSRSLAGFILITRMFVLLLIFLDSNKVAMGYDLLLANRLLFTLLPTSPNRCPQHALEPKAFFLKIRGLISS